MKSFVIGVLHDWERSDGRSFLPGVPGVISSHRLELMATDPAEVYASDEIGGDPVLIAAGVGFLRVRFSSIGGAALEIRSSGDVWMRRRRPPQVLPENDLPSFTTIEPGGVRPGSDLVRMMHIVQANARQREAALSAELERMNSRLTAAEQRANTPPAVSPAVAAAAATPVSGSS